MAVTKTPAKLTGLPSRFSLASAVRRHRTILRIIGERGTGKTRLGLTGPSPVLIQSFDKGTEGVVEEFREQGKEIYEREYEWDPGAQGEGVDLQQMAIDIRDTFEGDLTYALENGIRLIMIDKESDLWQLYRYAEFGGPSEKPKDYATLNQRYMSMINKVKMYPAASLLLIQAMKDEWGTANKRKPDGSVVGSPVQTGVRIPWGFDRIDELVMAEIRCRRVGNDFFFDFKSPHDPEYGKCRTNKALSGESLPAMNLSELGTLLVPGSEESDWL